MGVERMITGSETSAFHHNWRSRDMGNWQMLNSHRWLLSPADVDVAVRDGLAACWLDVSNAGAAVGFPFLPVTNDEVISATDRLIKALDPCGIRVLVALEGEALIGWLVLELNQSPLTSHWAKVFRVQTSLDYRGIGVGRGLMQEAARSARDDLLLEQLHLELRAGQGLEGFYESCGWQEVGRWPGSLRLSAGDDRDEVLMLLRL